MIPVVSIGLILTNPVHGLVWEIGIGDRYGLPILELTYGPWFWVIALYTAVLLFVGTGLLLRLAVRSEYLYLDQAILLCIGSLVPWVAAVISVSGVIFPPGIGITSVSFAVAGSAFGYVLFRQRLDDCKTHGRKPERPYERQFEPFEFSEISPYESLTDQVGKACQKHGSSDDRVMSAQNGVIEVTDETYDAVIDSKDIVLLYFREEWSNMCHYFDRSVEKLAETDRELLVAKIDRDENPTATKRFDIQFVPMAILFENGDPVEFLGDDVRYPELERRIEGYL